MKVQYKIIGVSFHLLIVSVVLVLAQVCVIYDCYSLETQFIVW